MIDDKKINNKFLDFNNMNLHKLYNNTLRKVYRDICNLKFNNNYQ